MRDRSRTPFFPLPRGSETPLRRLRTPLGTRTPLERPRPALRRLPARALEGKVVGDGRFLLLRKVAHDGQGVRFLARDLYAGLEIELELHPDPESQGGFAIGRSDLTPQRGLPNLLAPPITMEVVLPETKRRRMRSWLRVALRGKDTEV